jgi:hypothetical protein
MALDEAAGLSRNTIFIDLTLAGARFLIYLHPQIHAVSNRWPAMIGTIEANPKHTVGHRAGPPSTGQKAASHVSRLRCNAKSCFVDAFGTFVFWIGFDAVLLSGTHYRELQRAATGLSALGEGCERGENTCTHELKSKVLGARRTAVNGAISATEAFQWRQVSLIENNQSSE